MNTSARAKKRISDDLPAEEYDKYCRMIGGKLVNLQKSLSVERSAVISIINDITNAISPDIQLPREMFTSNNFLESIILLFDENNFELIMILSKFLSRVLYVTDKLVEHFPPEFLSFLMNLVLLAPKDSNIDYLINLMCNLSSEVDAKNKLGDQLDNVLIAYGERRVTVAFITFIFNMTPQAKISDEFVQFIFNAISCNDQEIIRIGLWTLSNYAKHHGIGATSRIIKNLEWLLNFFENTNDPNQVEAILSIFSYCLKYMSCSPSDFPIDFILKLCTHENQTVQFASLQFIRIAASRDPLLLFQSGVLSLMEITEASYRVMYLIVWIVSQILAASKIDVLEQLPLLEMIQFLFSKMEGENLQNLVLQNLWGMKITMESNDQASLFSELLEVTGAYEVIEELSYSENQSISEAANLIFSSMIQEVSGFCKSVNVDVPSVPAADENSAKTPKIKFVYNPK